MNERTEKNIRMQARRPQPQKKRRRRRGKRRGSGMLKAMIVVAVVVLLVLAALLFVDWEPEPKQSYPVEYSDLIYSYAAQNGLEPAHVAAVILAESSYDPAVTSGVNAQGLMQIMPDTGEWIAHKLDESYSDGCLYDPATNIRYGCWYLGYLMRRYDGDMTCATAAYHSGQGEVDSWLKDPAYSADGRTLHSMQGKNVTNYVDRILNYYEKYAEIYA